jgi:hypothetical protein
MLPVVQHPGRREQLHNALRRGPHGPIGARTEWAAHGSQGVAPQSPCLVRWPCPTPRGNGVTTSTASSTWHRLPHVQRGGLPPSNAVVRVAHPVLCTRHL